MSNLFESLIARPLAEKMRPTRLELLVGQEHLLAPDAPLGRMLRERRASSMILWGPPGSGKTTLAKIIAEHVNMNFEPLSAVFSGVSDLRKVFDKAVERKKVGEETLLFVDEIHRFNKAQQDVFLPLMEAGTLFLVGATTENPSFELNSALLSRAQVMVLNRLSLQDLDLIVKRAENELGVVLPLSKAAREHLLDISDGDGRVLLNLVEQISSWNLVQEIDLKMLQNGLNKRATAYDKAGEHHYNLISALHKSVRGSDPDAALYWFARMIEGGEDPRYLARRLVRMAIEDIGLADPDAQAHCLSSWQTFERLGSPEGELALAQAVVYLALAPKSNSAYVGYIDATKSARENGSLPPPKHILNAPTDLMKNEGYGKDYAYDHDFPEGISGQNYFPEAMNPEVFYRPVNRGFEKKLGEYSKYLKSIRAQRKT